MCVAVEVTSFEEWVEMCEFSRWGIAVIVVVAKCPALLGFLWRIGVDMVDGE